MEQKRDMTNYERIKAMSVEEMAEILYDKINCEDCPVRKQGKCDSVCECFERMTAWLESECDT
jgi:hypothetical protein